MASQRIAIVGPASWNQLVYLDELPPAHPHTRFAESSHEVLGGTSAGKALHLAALGRDVELDALLGDDAAGAAVRRALEGAGLSLHIADSEVSERHLNLMTRAGERVSIYLGLPATTVAPEDDPASGRLNSADIAVVDLAERGRRLLPGLAESGVPLWTDLHDYDGHSEFHRPFLEAAEVVFMNGDQREDHWQLLAECLRAGPRLAVCTLGAEGAIALDSEGRRYQVAATPVEVVDTNGAGDAFFAGFLDAHLAGAGVQDCLLAGARQAVVALGTRQLHPVLDSAAGGAGSGTDARRT